MRRAFSVAEQVPQLRLAIDHHKSARTMALDVVHLGDA